MHSSFTNLTTVHRNSCCLLSSDGSMDGGGSVTFILAFALLPRQSLGRRLPLVTGTVIRALLIHQRVGWRLANQ